MGRCGSIVSLALIILMLAGCGGEPDPYLREDPFVVREFKPFSGERWVGNAVCYGPHRDGQRPGDSEPSAAQIREDLQLMLPHWNLLRIYGSGGFAETLLQVIRADGLDMKVMLGVWIVPDDADANRDEVKTAIRLTKEFEDVIIAVSVGNETQIDWSAHRCSFDNLLVNVRHVRARVSVPVTVADDFNYWNKDASRAIAARSTSSPCTPIPCGTGSSSIMPCPGFSTRSPRCKRFIRTGPWFWVKPAGPPPSAIRASKPS